MEMSDMEKECSLHRDCRNFAPLDVAKGICHRSKEIVPADDPCCPKLVLVERCRICVNFASTADDRGLGKCMASRSHFNAYGDMISTTCESYRATAGG
jgi:4-hydroxyphenylacetate decarboxylase small subunit